MRQQNQHVGGIAGYLVGRRIAEPVAAAAARHIGADDADRPFRPGAQCAGERVEVAALSGQSVYADDQMRGVRVTP